jgi:putative ABC transport system substrate-binding protein
MRRRVFIAGLGSAAVWPVVARAQQAAMPVIGHIDMGAANQSGDAALVRGLNETGFFVDHNVSIENRIANGRVDRLPALAAELVQRKVDLIYGNSSAAAAAKAATSTIPIVFITATDPIANGLVASFNHPGGNVTGVRLRAGDETTAKLVELVHELLPAATTIGLLINPQSLDTGPTTAAVHSAANSFGFKVVVAGVAVESDFEQAMAKLVEANAGALVIGDNRYFATVRDRIVQLAMRNKLPIFSGTWFAAGALASYGSDDLDVVYQAGLYMGRILKGEYPGDLPVLQPTKFELMINLKVAKELGVTVPPSLLARADEVIE